MLGRWRELDDSVVGSHRDALEETRECDGMRAERGAQLLGRCEIVDACRQIVTDWAAGKRADIDEETIGRYLYTAGSPIRICSFVPRVRCE